MPLRLLAFLAVLALAACDSSSLEADPPGKGFRITVVAETPVGEAVEGLRVAVRPCLDVTLTGGQADDCAAIVPTTPEAPAIAARIGGVEYGFIRVEYGEQLGGETIDVALVWETVVETGNRGFEVQLRREGETEAAVLGFVDGAGTSDQARPYRFETTIEEGTYFFRLRQEDVDGTSTFTGEYDARYIRPMLPTSLEVAYPTPFVTYVRLGYVIGTDDPQVGLDVSDLTGRTVAILAARPEVGRHVVEWLPENNPTGVYVMRMRNRGTVIDSFAVVRWVPLAPDATDGPDVRGATDATGAFETQDITLAPAFYGPEELAYRGENNESLGTLSMPERVRITLIDPATGAQQTHDRAIVDGPNMFMLTWDQ